MQPVSMPTMPLRDVILIHILPPVISAVAVMFVGYITAKSNADKQAESMKNLHETVNGQMDKSLKSERASGVAEGRKAERDER